MTHPELLRAIAGAGHGAKILLADGNYPHSVWVSPRAERIALNLAPGLLTVDDGYREQLPGIPFTEVPRFDFYDEAKSDDVCCVVATGDQRLYANLLLTIGVRQPDE